MCLSESDISICSSTVQLSRYDFKLVKSVISSSWSVILFLKADRVEVLMTGLGLSIGL